MVYLQSKAKSHEFCKPDSSLAESLNSIKTDRLQWVHLHSQAVADGSEQEQQSQTQDGELLTEPSSSSTADATTESNADATADSMSDVQFPEAPGKYYKHLLVVRC
jgi:hypothetical protein